jgi:large subunit ribosomal protein L9
MAFTEVILTEKIEHLGAESDIVRVRAGFARNFLIPRGKALEKTKRNLTHVNALKARRAEREAQELNEAQELARRINKLKISIEIETGETGKAFGAITAADIAQRIRAELGGKIEIDRHRIHLEHPIKSTGDFEVAVKLHADITAKLALHVKAKGAEAAPAAEEAAEEARPKGKSRK